MTIICTICARGGSKGVKGKNTRKIAGKPLIAHTLETAKNVTLFDQIAVSSDSEQILEISERFGIKNLIKRPDELATDTAQKLPAIKHCVDTVEKKIGYKFDIITELDCTSPLRTIEDIKGAIDLLKSKKVSNIITGSESRRSPYFNLVEEDTNGFVRLSKEIDEYVYRRQDSPRCYDMNASIYVWNRDIFFKNMKVFYPDTLLYKMPTSRSVDIDSLLDFEIVEYLLSNEKNSKNQI